MATVNFTPADAGVSLSLPQERKEMLSVKTDELTGKTLVRINSSSISVIQECPRKAKYLLEDKWKAENESPATLFGRAIHKALEVFYRGQPEERILPKYEFLELMAYGHKPPPTNNDLIYRAVQAFVETASPLSTLPETDKRSIQNGVWILSEYFKTYIDDPYVAYVDEDGPFVEREFTYRFYEDSNLIIDLFGTIDFAFRHIHSGSICIGDHKTASFLMFGESSFFDREKPNHQYSIYAMAANRLFGIKSEDFIVNVIEVKAKPKTKNAKGVSFPRQVTKRTEEDFSELTEVVLDSVNRYLNYRSTNIWPMGPVGACTAFGGCQFKRVCASPHSVRETMIGNLFKKEDRNETK